MALQQELDPDFRFEPLPPIPDDPRFALPTTSSPLSPLAELPGKWPGKGFNVI